MFVLPISGRNFSQIYQDKAWKYQQNSQFYGWFNWFREMCKQWVTKVGDCRTRITIYLEKVESKILNNTKQNDTHHCIDNPMLYLRKPILRQLEDWSQSIHFWEIFLSGLEYSSHIVKNCIPLLILYKR